MNMSAAADAGLSAERLRDVESFLLNEAHLLDDRRFEEWIDLFTDEGYYWAPATQDQDNPLEEVSLIYDDLETMKTRVKRLRHPRIHGQDPHARTARVVANAFVEDASPDGRELTVRSKFLIYEYQPRVPEGTERVFGGTYRHRLIAHGNKFKIHWKKAMLANCDARLGAFFIYF